MKYTGIIYDIDGTILNTIDMNMYPLIKIIKEELAIEYTFDQVKKYLSYPGKKALEELGIKDIEGVYARWVKYVNEYPGGATLYDGFNEIFEKLNGVFKQGIVSSKTYQQYQIDFVLQGLDKYFDAVILEEDSTKHKPDPEPLIKCLEKMKLSNDQVIYIGDTYSDYLAAKNAKMAFALAKWGCLDDSNIIADFVLEQPIDILKIIKD